MNKFRIPTANDFHHPELLLRFFNHFGNIDCDVIAAGDIFEMLQCDGNRLLYYNTDILNKVFSMKNLYCLHGNHDWIMEKYYPAVYLADGVHIEHGHRFDMYNANPSRIGSVIAKGVGWFERLLHQDSDEWLSKIAEIKGKITPASENYPGSFTEYMDGARGILENPAIDVVVMGHTHRAGIWQLENGIYVNAGCWTGEEDPTYVMVSENTVKLYDALTKELLAETDRMGVR